MQKSTTKNAYFSPWWLVLVWLTLPAKADVYNSDLILPLRLDGFTQQCAVNISFEVDSVASGLHAYHLHQAWLFNASYAFLPICFELPNTTTATLCNSHLSCREQAALVKLPVGNQNDVSPLLITIVDTMHRGFVYNQRMVITPQHTLKVMLHELAHLFAFADEYPLPEHVAAYQCDVERYLNKTISINYAAFDYVWDILAAKRWLRYEQLCNQSVIVMDLPQYHFLQYSDVAFIPFVYKHMWQQKLFTIAHK